MNEDEIIKRFDQLEGEIKERETSVLRAIRTIINDLKDNPREFPQSAFIGLVFAYLRPRVILIFGSFLAAGFTFLQVFVLFRQTEIMNSQKDVEGFQVSQFVVDQLKSRQVNTFQFSINFGEEIASHSDCKTKIYFGEETDYADLRRMVPRHTMDTISKLGEKKVLRAAIVDGLEITISSEDGLSAFPAYRSLALLGEEIIYRNIYFNNSLIAADDLVLDFDGESSGNAGETIISNSFVNDIDYNSSDYRSEIHQSVIISSLSDDDTHPLGSTLIYDSIIIADWPKLGINHDDGTNLLVSNGEILTSLAPHQTCTLIDTICRKNKLIACK